MSKRLIVVDKKSKVIPGQPADGWATGAEALDFAESCGVSSPSITLLSKVRS